MTLQDIEQLARDRRQARWDKEAAAKVEREKSRVLIAGLAKWKHVQPREIKISNTCCHRAPADLSCTYVTSSNPYNNPCVFCGSPEADIF